MMMQRSFFSVIAASIFVLLLIGITGCNGLFAKSPPNLMTPSGQPDAAIFVSKQAPVMVSMLVNPDRLQALERDGVSQLTTKLLANTGLDYKQDIQPWLGKEITLAVTSLDLDRDPENGQQPGYLLALATEHPKESREFVELLFSKQALAGANLTTEQYKGIKLLYATQQKTFVEKKQTGGYFSTPNRQDKISNSKSNTQNPLAAAVVGNNFVLFANDLKVLRDAINNVQAPELNLLSSSKYQQATKQLPKGALAVAYLNLPIVTQWQGLATGAQTYDSQIISLVSDSKELLAETAFLAKEEILSPATQLSKPVEALQYIPASASLAVVGSNLSSLDNSNLALLLKQVTASVSSSEGDVISGVLQPLVGIQKHQGINWKEDIFSWVKGEYALGLLSRGQQTNPDWIFVTEKSDATPTAISRLNEIAASAGLALNSLSLREQKISTWTELRTATTQSSLAKDRQSFTIEAKVLGAYTDAGNYEIFASSIEAIDEALRAKENPLINNKNFQNSMTTIPQPNQGYVYLDWIKSKEFVERQLPILKLVEVIGQPFFQKLNSFTISSYGSDTGLLKGGVFFQFD